MGGVRRRWVVVGRLVSWMDALGPWRSHRRRRSLYQRVWQAGGMFAGGACSMRGGWPRSNWLGPYRPRSLIPHTLPGCLFQRAQRRVRGHRAAALGLVVAAGASSKGGRSCCQRGAPLLRRPLPWMTATKRTAATRSRPRILHCGVDRRRCLKCLPRPLLDYWIAAHRRGDFAALWKP